MKKIIIFGASGRTGKQVVREAFNSGYEVTVVVSNTKDYIFNDTQIKIIKGDVFKPETFESALYGKDAVISCLGIKKRLPAFVYSEGITNIMLSMQKAGVNRLICLSSRAVDIPENAPLITKFIVNHILRRFFNYFFADMKLMENILCDSNLNWTLIRSPRLLNGLKTGNYRTSINEYLTNPTSLSHKDLADYIIYYMDDEKIFKSRVEISY